MRKTRMIRGVMAAFLLGSIVFPAGCGKSDSSTGAATANVATQLSVSTQPSAASANAAALAVQPVVQLKDASGNAVSKAGIVITASITGGGATLGGTATATTGSTGSAAFTDLSITGLVGSYTLTFTSASPVLTATSTAIVISAGHLAKLAITTQPSATVVTGSVLSQQPVIQVVDVSGNPVSVAQTAITASIATGAGNLTGNITGGRTNASGSAAFTDIGLIGPGGGAGTVTLAFSSAGLQDVISAPIAITALGLPALAGTWSGTWVDTRYSVSGTITNVILTQTASAFSGTGTIDLSSLGLGSQNGTATGTIAGNVVTFTFTAAGVGSGSGVLNTTVASGSGNVTALNFGAFGFQGTASSTQITGTFQFTSPTGGNGTITLTKH